MANNIAAIAKSKDIFRGQDSEAQVKEIKDWLKGKGVRNFEPVPLYADILTKVSEIYVKRYCFMF